jgi:hypothetical protein
MLTKNIKNTASLLHVSAFSKYIIPFGNYIIPILIWTSKKDSEKFIDENGKQVLNFQISLLLYFIITLIICIPFAVNFGLNISALETEKTITPGDLTSFSGSLIVFIALIITNAILFIIDIYATIMGSLKAQEGKVYNYPLSIKFFK